MALKLNFEKFIKKVDSETGSILYYKKGIKGLPEKVIEGDGFTVEIKNNEVYLVDIFNAEKVLKSLLKTVKLKAA